jgi:hypothetical protein
MGFLIQFWLDASYVPGMSIYVTGSQFVGLGMFMGGSVTVLFCLVISVLRAASAIANPIRRITEIFQNGMIIHGSGQAHLILWSNMLQYRIGYKKALFSSAVSRFDIETTDGRWWRFHDHHANVIKLKELLTGLPHQLLLNRALAEIYEHGSPFSAL